VVERGITTAGYGLLYVSSSTNVVWYALVFLVGASIGCLLALWGAYRVSNTNQNKKTDFKELGSIWENKKSLLIAALPFAITLGVLPYVIRIEKFILSVELGLEEVALFHVAQLAWLAGLLIPQAMRAALLPVLGASRGNKELFNAHLNRVESIAFGLVPIGLVSGAGIVTLLLPVAFPSEYFDGSLGASAQDIFMLLLAGWAMTVLSVPSYTSLQAGNQPWRFTGLIALVVIMATLIGWFLISWGADKDAGFALEMAAYASIASTFIMLFAGIGLSQRWKEFKGRGLQWILTIGLVFVTCYAFSERSWWALSGLPLFILLPQALEAMRTTVGSQTPERTSEAE
jgi:O-antigen/teichoic acid export membrane protein